MSARVATVCAVAIYAAFFVLFGLLPIALWG